MRPGSLPYRALVLLTVLCAGTQLGPACNGGSKHEPKGQQTFTSPQSKPILLNANGTLLFVANTTSGTVSVIDTSDNSLVKEIEVGLEPSGLALKPNGLELWVSNHVSDSVSVIDTNFFNETYLEVTETIQEFTANGGTLFDEPVGIAFAEDGSKAFVALSSKNDIAVIDTSTYAVTNRIHITAQEPRSLFVRNGKLYVAAFESNNQTELSICPTGTENGGGGPNAQCTLDENDLGSFIINSPNIPGADTRIVVDLDVPDRDLFVIDVASETIDQSVTGVGTLLYDLVVTSGDEVFITQTDALNFVNGGNNDDSSQNLIALDNRMFLNQIGHVDCSGGGSCSLQTDIELDAAIGTPHATARLTSKATPFGIALSGDDGTLVVTAAGTSRVFTMNASTGAVLDTLDLNDGLGAGNPGFGQQIPKGVALLSDGGGAPQTAYVLNTLENTVSVIDVSNPSSLSHTTKFSVGSDPTPAAIRRGRIAFTNAFASSSGTFSCESCHPDGNTDQLLWRIGGRCGPGCGGDGLDDEIRSTMPVRGLKNTLPLHWDGSLGDPFGGPNGTVGSGGSVPASCDISDGDDHDCFMDLVVHSLSGVMCDQDPATEPAGCPLGGNELSAGEQDDMAVFLANVSYPPARGRRMDDVVSSAAHQGFSNFFVNVGGLGVGVGILTCADMDSGCHALPLGADHNSAQLGGFDAPTMRGMLDRWLHFSIGITAPEEVLEWVKTAQPTGLGFNTFATQAPFDPAEGMEEDVTLGAAFAIFEPVYGAGMLRFLNMFEQASTGHSGSLARQVTLNATTATAPELTDTEAVLDYLEAADLRGQVNLRAVGVRRVSGNMKPIVLSFRSDGNYKNGNNGVVFNRAQLIALAAGGDAVLTFTAALGRNWGSSPQPLLSVTSTGNGATGNPNLPVFDPGSPAPVALVGIDVHQDATVVLEGEVNTGSVITCVGGSFTPYCDSQLITITFGTNPSTEGLQLLQVQNPSGPLSVEFPLCVDNSGVNACL